MSDPRPIADPPVQPGRLRMAHLLPLLVFLLIAAAAGAMLLLGRDPRVLPSALLDKPVPDFELPAVPDGEVPGLASADLAAGRVTLVNVFASWCVPCRIEHPILMRLARDEGVTVYAINWKDDADKARRFLEELGNPYAAIGFDESGRVGIDWGVYGVPETYVVDGAGRIRYKHPGPLSARDLDQTLLPLLETLER